MAKGAATGDCMSKWQFPRVARFFELSHQMRTVVREVARNAIDGVVHGRVFGEVREAMTIFCFAMCGVRKVWERFAGAKETHNQ